MSHGRMRLKIQSMKRQHRLDSEIKLTETIAQDESFKSRYKRVKTKKLQQEKSTRKPLSRRAFWQAVLAVGLLVVSNYVLLEIVYRGSIYFAESFSSDPQIQNGGAVDLRFIVGVVAFVVTTSVSAVLYEFLLRASRAPYPNDPFRGAQWLISSIFRILTISAVPTLSGYALTLPFLTEISEGRVLALILCVPLTILSACAGAYFNRESCRPKPKG